MKEHEICKDCKDRPWCLFIGKEEITNCPAVRDYNRGYEKAFKRALAWISGEFYDGSADAGLTEPKSANYWTTEELVRGFMKHMQQNGEVQA